jgi:hypothetical protein
VELHRLFTCSADMPTPYDYVIAIILAVTLAGTSFWLGRNTAGPQYVFAPSCRGSDCDWYDKMLYGHLPARGCTVESPHGTTTRMDCGNPIGSSEPIPSLH